MAEVTEVVCVECTRPFTWVRPPGKTGNAPKVCSDKCAGDRRRRQSRERARAWTPEQRARRVRGPRLSQPCSVEDCTRFVHSSGMCALHYNRLRRTGSVGEADVTIAPQGSGSWSIRKGYRVYTVRAKGQKRQTISEHRMVMEQIIGRPLLPSENIHHINGDRTDNRPENLELWTKSQPSGQRVIDKVAWATELLKLYAPDRLS